MIGDIQLGELRRKDVRDVQLERNVGVTNFCMAAL